MADVVASVRASFQKAGAGVDGFFTKEEFAAVFMDIGFSQEQFDAVWMGAKGDSEKKSYNEVLDWISNEASGSADAKTAPLCQYIKQRNLCDLSAVDMAYLEENNISDVLDVLLTRIVKMKPKDTNRFCADLFSGVLAEQKRLVLMASECPSIDELKAAVKPIGDMGAEIITATWDFERDPQSLNELVSSLVDMHGTFKTVALCCHGTGQDSALVERRKELVAKWEEAGKPMTDDGKRNFKGLMLQPDPNFKNKWYLTRNHGVDLASGEADYGVNEAIHALAEAASVRVDILACSLAGTKKGRDFVTSWENSTNTNFAASTNMTGNVEQGADWILETDGVDVMKVYFDEEKLYKWKGTLGKKWNNDFDYEPPEVDDDFYYDDE